MPKQTSIKTAEEFEQTLNKAASDKLFLDLKNAILSQKIANLKAKFIEPIVELTKSLKPIKARCAAFLRTKAGIEYLAGRKTGQTSAASFSLIERTSIKPLRGVSEEEIIGNITEAGLTHLIDTTISYSKDGAAKLTDEQLESIGLQRVTSKTFDWAPLEDKTTPKAETKHKTVTQ